MIRLSFRAERSEVEESRSIIARPFNGMSPSLRMSYGAAGDFARHDNW